MFHTQRKQRFYVASIRCHWFCFQSQSSCDIMPTLYQEKKKSIISNFVYRIFYLLSNWNIEFWTVNMWCKCLRTVRFMHYVLYAYMRHSALFSIHFTLNAVWMTHNSEFNFILTTLLDQHFVVGDGSKYIIFYLQVNVCLFVFFFLHFSFSFSISHSFSLSLPYLSQRIHFSEIKLLKARVHFYYALI